MICLSCAVLQLATCPHLQPPRPPIQIDRRPDAPVKIIDVSQHDARLDRALFKRLMLDRRGNRMTVFNAPHNAPNPNSNIQGKMTMGKVSFIKKK